jgi:hypothetical protein
MSCMCLSCREYDAKKILKKIKKEWKIIKFRDND